jgi:glycosyltransferase involved in cell wall biosynthesis
VSALAVLHVVPHLSRTGGYERQALTLARHQAREQGLLPLLLTHAEASRHDAHSAGWSPLSSSARGSGSGRELAAGEAPVETAAEAGGNAPHGVPLHRLERGLRRYHPGRWWRNRRRHGELPDVVHVHAMHKLGGQVVELARRAGIPTLVKVPTPADVELFAHPERWRELVEPEEPAARYGARWRFMAATTWRRLRRATVFLALNADIAARLRQEGVRAELVGNGVDCARYAPPAAAERAAARAALGLAPDAPCVVTCGRLVARKDVDCALAALARLPGATLLVCGDGPRAGALRERAAALGIGTRVRWLGMLADTRPALHAADVFVHASRSEGLPNALLEALACGLPAVVSDIPGHEDGTLRFPPGDDAALATRLALLLADGAARAAEGRAARERARTRHDLPIVAARLSELYARCLAEA